MDGSTEAVLEGGSRCLLALAGDAGATVLPMAYWYDGDALWMTAAAGTPQAGAVSTGGACLAYVRAPGGDGVIARGRARVLSLGDPVGLLLRAPAVAAAMVALAARQPVALLEAVRTALESPERWGPDAWVALRVGLSGTRRVTAGDVPPGLAPALPAEVPADVRRAAAGQRRVLVVAASGGLVDLLPAVWDTSFRLTVAPGGQPLSPAGPVAVAVDGEPPEAGPAGARGLVLHGDAASGRLEVRRATYWRGFDVHTVDVTVARPGVELPD